MSRAARVFWVCALTAGLCFVALLVVSKTTLETGGMFVFDNRVWGYDGTSAREYLMWIAGMPDAQATYLGMFHQLDTVFSVLLTVAMCGGIWLNTRGANIVRRVLMLGAPGAYLLIGLMENARVAEMLQTGVSVADQVIRQASSFTMMKWTLLVVSLLVMLNEYWRTHKEAVT